MDWAQAITILAGNAGLFLWATRQSRTDFLHLDRKLEENRKETTQIIKESGQVLKAIQDEIKDFHNRLCSIEEKKGKYK